MKKHIVIIYFILAASYSIGFCLFEVYLQNINAPDSLIAIAACSHNIISTLICAYIFFRTFTGITAILWSLGFVIVGIADIFHAVLHWVYPLPETHIVSIFAGELYNLFLLFHVFAIYRTYGAHRAKIGLVLSAAIATMYLATTIYCMTIPLLGTDHPFYYYFNVSDIYYNILIAVIIGMLFVNGLTSRYSLALFFISSYILVFSSGFALDTLSYLTDEGPKLSIYNYGWELGFSLITVTLLWVKLSKRKIEELFESTPFNSLRFQVASLSLAAILAFMFSLRAVEIPKSFWANTDISILLTIFLITWTATNSAALWLNKKLSSLETILSKDDLHDIPIQYEIGNIIDIYRSKNKKLAEAKTTIESQKRSIEMTSKQIAHDVRKPLSSMKAILKILPDIKNNPSMLNRMLVNVDRNISQANDMLSEMLEFSGAEIELYLSKQNPQSIITAALGDALRNKGDANVDIEYELKHKNYLNVDGDRIVRVLTNIISNAVEAMGDRGRIWIRTEDVLGRSRVKGEGLKDEVEDKVEGGMKIVIGNNGPVIPEDVQKKLFEPFFTKGKKGGTGLGLAICQKIVEMHGGHIEVRSYNESHMVNEDQEPKLSGQGLKDEVEAKVKAKENITEFIIELPASPGRLFVNEAELIYHSNELKAFREEAAAREEYGDTANTAEFMRLHKERGRPSYLLTVDDEPLFRETIRSLLNTIPQVKDHVKVVESGSAEEALTLFKAREFDYVIADIDMGRGKMNGYEMSRVILEKYPNTYVLIHSNKRKEEMDRQIRDSARGITPHPLPSPQRGEGGKFMGFLPKPMKQSELLQFLACKTFEAARATKSPAVPARKMLIVNDDPDLLLSFKILLKSPSLQVLGASNVSEALKHLVENHIDIILSDINLGADEPDGYEFLKKVREKDKSIPFYLISGYSRADEEPKAEKYGANGYLQLPVEKEQLMEILQ